MKTVVVTGASTGIGWGAAKVLVERGVRVFGSVRRREDGERLSADLGPHFSPVYFDVTDAGAVARAAGEVAAALGRETLFGLVNNAGIAVPGPLLHLPIDAFRRQLEVNVTGQLIVTQAFAPLLGADTTREGPPGRIVMISSGGGRNATPFIGAYNASKFALEGLSEALRRELMLFGIDVIVVAPGPVETAIWDKAAGEDMTPYLGTPFEAALRTARDFMLELRVHGLTSEYLGRRIHHALTARRPRVRYSVTPEAFRTFVLTSLPKRLADRVIARHLGLVKRR